jgi:GAF domain-containing protein
VADAPPEIRLERDRKTLDLIVAAEEKSTIDTALAAARERLSMDAAYVTTVTSEIQRIDRISGDPRALGVEPGTEIPIEKTYCHRMLAGKMPNVVPDTSREPAVSDLAATRLIGAYIGVPIELSDGRIHGTLCASSTVPREQLGEDEVRFMKVLARIVANRLQRPSMVPDRRGLRQ